jgi:hypothetical protein
MEIKITKLQQEAKNAGLKTNAGQTKEMRINSNKEAKLTLNGMDTEQVDSFCYLWSIVTKTSGEEEDVTRHIRQVKRIFIHLHPAWKNKSILRSTKL